MDSTNRTDDPVTSLDDADMLQQVLMNVRGSYPDSPYRQVDFQDLTEEDDFGVAA